MSTDQIIQLVSALGTLAVAVVAIWGERIRFLLGLGPKLILTLLDPQGEITTVSFNDGRSTVARYYHLKVSNKHGWSPASNVRVVITDLATPAADGHLVSLPLSGALQLMWRFASFHSITSTIGSDDICDLGHIQRGEKFVLTPFVSPNNFPKALDAGQKMRIEVKAIADNAESAPLRIEVSWDGKWDDGTLEMAKHLIVKEIKGSRIA